MSLRRSLAVATIVAMILGLIPVISVVAAPASYGATTSAQPAAARVVARGAGRGQLVRPRIYSGSLASLATQVKHHGPSKSADDEDNGLDGRSTVPSNGPTDPLLSQNGSNFPGSTGAITGTLANFEGVGNVNGKIPPDTNGDVGINDYLQVVNDSFDIFSKTTGTSLIGGPKNNNSLWAAGAPGTLCANNNRGDAIARYDATANRFVLTQFAFGATKNPSDECIAVSRTSDPVAGGWYLYDFAVSTAKFDDYPKVSIWPDGYYATFNWNGCCGTGVGAFAFDRANMLNGNPATFQCFGCDADGYAALTTEDNYLFADWDGTSAPAFGAPETMTRFVTPNVLRSYAMHVDWGVPANSTLSALPDVAVANFSPVGGISQPTVSGFGTPPTLDSLSDRLMNRLQYRNFGSYETMVVNHSVDVGSGQSGVRWYELRRGGSYGANWVLYQQGTFAPDTDSRWMGSIAMDKAGDIAAGYSVSSTSTFPSIRIAGRLPDDPLGLLPQGEVKVIDGTGTQYNLQQRWGDYSSMNIDPVDGCTFWYTQEYIATTVADPFANWQTRIASVRFPTCNPADMSVGITATPNQVNAGAELDFNVTATNNGTDTATNVVVTDTLPPGDHYATDTAGCSVVASTLTCAIGTMAAGTSQSFTIRTTVDPAYDATSGGPQSLTDTASVTADQHDPNTANNSASAGVVVNESADLKVTKTCDASVLAGQTGNCTIYVDNNGPSSARGVTLTDAATSNGAFTVSLVNPSQGTCLATPGPATTATVSCNFGLLGPATLTGPGRATVVVSYTANEGQSIADTATATSPTPDPNSANNSASASLPVTAVADLQITSDFANPSPVNAGTSLTFSVTVRNNGPSTAKNVVLTDALPAGVTVSSITAPSSTSCNAGVPGNPLQPTTCGFDVLGPGASLTMTVVTAVLPQTTGTLHSDAAVSSDTFDPNNSNNFAHTDTTVNVLGDISLAMSASPVPNVIAGRNLTYSATISNAGPSTARTIVLNENLPAGVTFAGTSISNGGSGTCAQVVGHPNQIQCQLNDLDPGQSVTVYTQVVVNASTLKNTVLTATGSATTSSNDPTPDSASAASTVDTSADLAGTLTAPSHVYKASTTMTFTSVVTNLGPSDAQSVVLTVSLPGTSYGHYVSNNAPAGVCSVTTSTKQTIVVTCNLGTIAATGSYSVQVVYFFQGNQKIQTITNAVTSATADPATANNTATWTVGPK